MSLWPVAKPPIDPNPPGINLAAGPGGPPDPIVFDGPLNVFIGLYHTALAYVTAAETKQDYDAIAPTPGTEPIVPVTKPAPLGPPASTGSPVAYTGAGVVDPGIAARVRGRKH